MNKNRPPLPLQTVALAVAAALATPVFAQQLEATLPDVQVNGQRVTAVGGPATLGFQASIPSNDLELRKPGDALVEAGLAAWDVSGSMGLATTVQARGFAINPQSTTGLSNGKILLNGHPDVGRRFARDPMTIESINYVGMTDATVAGASTPAGTVTIHSKTPTGETHFVYGLALGSNGLARGTVDAEQHVGSLQVRLVAAQQSGEKTVEGLTDNHNTVLLSSRLATSATSALRLDVESQTTHLPFPFGTVYAGNHFWYDKPYVSAADSKGARRNDRLAAYWDQRLGDDTTLRAHAQRASGKRNDDLLGFWTVTSPTAINSYARRIDEHYDQTDWGLSVERTLTLGGHSHHARLAYTDSLQALDFSGPQSIGLFSINLADPQFTTPLASISLTPRVLKERYSEKTLSASDRIKLSPRWELQAALTRNTIQIDSSASSAPMTPAAAHTLTNLAFTASHQLAAALRVWLGGSNAFEPNRGMVKSGNFLPPKQAQQVELGTAFKQGDQSLQVTLFDIQQTNLAAVDPTDRNYLIPFGAARSSGLQFTARHTVDTITWYAGATLQNARVTTPTSASQGVYIPGMADRYGAVGATWQPRAAHWPTFDLKMLAIGERPGDSNGSFFAPGVAVWNLNVFGKAPGTLSAQWALGVWNLLDTRYVRALSAADYVWQGERRKFTLSWTQQL